MKPWGLRCLVALAVFFTVVYAAAYAYWWWANDVPAFEPPVVSLPQPNGFDALLAASRAVRAPVLADHAARERNDIDLKWPLPLLREAVAINRHAIRQARTALSLPYLEPPQYGLDIQVPYRARFRNLARLFAANSRVAAAQGDWDGAASYALDAMELGSRIPHGGPLSGGSLGIACHAMGYRELEAALPRLSRRGAQRSVHRLRAIAAGWPSLADTLRQEGLLTRSLVIQLTRPIRSLGLWGSLEYASRPYLPDDPYPWCGSCRPGIEVVVPPKRPALENMDRYFTAVIEETRKPRLLRVEPPVPVDWINQRFMPALWHSIFKWDLKDAQLALVETWLHARLFQLEHHRSASAAELLTAARALPDDPFGDGPCRYLIRGDGFLVYSVGPDGVDDGGQAVSVGDRDPTPDSRGDLVLGPTYPADPQDDTFTFRIRLRDIQSSVDSVWVQIKDQPGRSGAIIRVPGRGTG